MATNQARGLELLGRRLAPAGSFGSLRSVVALGALGGVVAGGAAVALGALADPPFLVPPPSGTPDWIAGPLPRLGSGLGPSAFGLLMAFMCACYLAALACADALRAGPALAAIGGLHVLLALAPPLLSPDVFGYVGYARLGALHGVDPYLHGAEAVPGDPIRPYVKFQYLPSPYGPLFTALSYGLAPLGVAGALWTLKLLAGAAGLGCVSLVWACARRLGRPALPAVLFVGLNPFWLVFAVGGAHNDLLMMLLVLTGLFFALGGRERIGAAAVASAAAVKASAGLLLPFMVLGARRRRRVLLAGMAGLLALAAGAIAVFGADGFLGYLSMLDRHGNYVSRRSLPHDLGEVLGLGGATAGLRVVATSAFALVAVTMLVRTWRGSDWIAAAGWTIFALLVTTTWLWPWYIVWLLPLAALTEDRRLRVAALLVAAFLFATRVPLLSTVGPGG